MRTDDEQPRKDRSRLYPDRRTGFQSIEFVQVPTWSTLRSGPHEFVFPRDVQQLVVLIHLRLSQLAFCASDCLVINLRLRYAATALAYPSLESP